jgi:outer membrane protein OmpA-like peptidoglycan-associated protein
MQAEDKATRPPAKKAAGGSSAALASGAVCALGSSAPQLENCKVGEAVVVPGLVFAYKKTALDDGAEKELLAIAEDLKGHDKLKLEIDGFTDAVASGGYNHGLAVERAEAVKAFLLVQGVKAEQLSVHGVGKAAPVGDNSTEAGRAANRRVGFTVLANG